MVLISDLARQSPPNVSRHAAMVGYMQFGRGNGRPAAIHDSIHHIDSLHGEHSCHSMVASNVGRGLHTSDSSALCALPSPDDGVYGVRCIRYAPMLDDAILSIPARQPDYARNQKSPIRRTDRLCNSGQQLSRRTSSIRSQVERWFHLLRPIHPSKPPRRTVIRKPSGLETAPSLKELDRLILIRAQSQ